MWQHTNVPVPAAARFKA